LEFIGRSWTKTSAWKGFLQEGRHTRAGNRSRSGSPHAPGRVKPASVQGEKRYRLHPAYAILLPEGYDATRDFGVAGIAIDRFGGTIVGQQLEEVTE